MELMLVDKFSQQPFTKGAILLDTECPGWAARINIYELETASIHRCILGQLFGEYAIGIQSLFGDVEPLAENRLAREYGFEADFSTGPRPTAYQRLTSGWLAEIAHRLTVRLVCSCGDSDVYDGYAECAVHPIRG